MSNIQEQIIKAVDELAGAAEKLVIVTGKPGSGKSKVLRELGDVQKWHYVDCKNLVTVADLQGSADKNATAVEIIKNIFDNYRTPVLLLDKMQSLFSASLELDVMQVMKAVSAGKTLIVAWPGYHEDGNLNFKNENTGVVTAYSVAGTKMFILE